MRSYHVSTFPPPIMGYIYNYFSIMIPIDRISMATSVPLLKHYPIQLCYDYNIIIYNLIRIQYSSIIYIFIIRVSFLVI
jgi:hypothetical protein